MPKITNISAQVAPVLPDFAGVAAHLAHVTSNLAAIGTKLLLRSSFAPVLAKLAHVRTCFAPVLPDLAAVSANLFSVRTNFPAIGSQFPTLCRLKATAVRLLRECNRRHSAERDNYYKQASKYLSLHLVPP